MSRLGAVDGLQTANLEASTLEQELEAQFAELPTAVWVDRLRQAGVSAHAVVPVAERMVDPWGRSHVLSVTQPAFAVAAQRQYYFCRYRAVQFLLLPPFTKGRWGISVRLLQENPPAPLWQRGNGSDPPKTE